MDTHKDTAFDAENEQEQGSCNQGITRKAFVDMVLKRGAIAGALFSAPAIVDAFLAPPAIAARSLSGTGGESGNSGKEP